MANNGDRELRARGQAMLLAGASVSEVCSTLDVHQSTVKYWKKTLKEDARREAGDKALKRIQEGVEAQLIQQGVQVAKTKPYDESLTLIEQTSRFFSKVLASWQTMADLLADPRWVAANPEVAIMFHRFLAERSDGLADRLGDSVRDEEEPVQAATILMPGDPRLPAGR